MTEYQSIPFWSWNDKLEPEELRRQIRWMKDNGMGGFFMHARGGLKTPYLSEEWMECVDACVDEAEKLGMDAWVYDENGWPSGFAGGALLEQEENRDCYLTHTVGELDADAYVSYRMEGDNLIRTQEAVAGAEYLNVYLHVSVSTVDILNPKVVRQFLDKTHEQYRIRYGEDFSKKIKGFFTDEPQYYRGNTSYSKMLVEYFREHYNEDVRDGLGLLFCEKEGYRAFRYKYWYAMNQLMVKNFGKQIYDWCEENGVQLTGHYVEENSLAGHMTCCAGIMPFYKYMHIPGIDWLGRGHQNRLAMLQLNSVAQQYGKKHTLTETFGCCGWDVTPMELKTIAEFQYVGGVNLMCHHLVPYSEHGQRKRDYPAHYSDVNPWVRENFKEFNDYFTNVGYLLSNSKEQVSVAMLHPIRSAYFDYKRLEKEFNLAPLHNKFVQQVKMLSNANVMFHFLDESLLAEDGFVKDGKIGCGLCSYEYLVLPTVYTMDKTTEQLLKEYVKQGGKVLLLDGKPEYLEGEKFSYDYLQSNITWEQLCDCQNYCVKDKTLPIHATYRIYEGKPFIYVQNYSNDENCQVEFCLKDGYRSFEWVNMQTKEAVPVSNVVSLEAGEAKVLFLSKEAVPERHQKETVFLNPQYEWVSDSGNYLTLDTARYSKDNVTFSEELPCMGIFQQMLQERYEGTLYLKTGFTVKSKPNAIWLLAETGRTAWVRVNGQKVEFTASSDLDRNILKADIASCVTEGENEILVCMNYYQSEDVYYALFGENVTETLRNCLVYDTDIEPMYLFGDFGVYEQDGYQVGQYPQVRLGRHFYLDKRTTKIDHFIENGYPFFAGTMRLRQTLELQNPNVLLKFAGQFQSAKLFVNGHETGTFLMENTLDISAYAVAGKNEIELELVVSNRNLMGPHHCQGQEMPTTVWVSTFELDGTWENGRSSQYRDSYALIQVDLY